MYLQNIAWTDSKYMTQQKMKKKNCVRACVCVLIAEKKNAIDEQMTWTHSFIYANDNVQCPAHHAPDVITPATTALLCCKSKYSHSMFITSHFHMKFFLENIPVEINI